MTGRSKDLERSHVQPAHDPYVVIRARIRRSTLERVYAVARAEKLRPATLIRVLLARAVRRRT
jgi:hypothetical protein